MMVNLFKINKLKLNIFLSTLNFILFFVGFQLVTSVLLPAVSDIEGVTRAITIPYRGFTLLLSLVVIVLNLKRKPTYYPNALKAFLFFWGIMIIRIFYDVFVREDIIINNTSQLWLYIFGICFA